MLRVVEATPIVSHRDFTKTDLLRLNRAFSVAPTIEVAD
jgi:hypothetical protein